jgi:RNA polymerase sigma-70 factor (ECF subfamily)
MQFADLYRANFELIWRTVRQLGVAEKDALDAAQEVFMIAYRRLPQFEGRSTVRTWLHGIAYRVAADRRRGASARREVLDGGFAVFAESAKDPSAELEQRELLRLLERVLNTLPFEQRAVFTMHEMEGLTQEEIATALGIPPGTVGSRLRLARGAFSRAVQQLGDGPDVKSQSGGE